MRFRSKTFIIFVSIIFFNVCCFGQMPDKLKQYYTKVNEAELFIVNNQYDEAIKAYENAFINKKYPFCRDKYNLAVCYVYKNKKKEVSNALDYLLQFGYPIDSLKKNKNFAQILNTNTGIKFLKKQRTFFFNNKYRVTIDSIYDRDQFYRKNNNQVVYLDSIRRIDSQNIKSILNLIEINGFPSENKVGVYGDFDYNSFRIIVIHSFKGVKNGQTYDFTNLLLKSVYEGDLDVRVAATLISGSSGNDVYGTFFNGLIRYAIYDPNEDDFIKKKSISGIGIVKLNNKNLDKINFIRTEIGLETIDNLRKKIILQHKNNSFKLLNVGESRKIFIVSEDEYQNKINNLIFLE